MKVRDAEYAYLYCCECEDTMKLSRNGGGDWWVNMCGDGAAEFLRDHSGCDPESIKILIE